MLATTDVVSCHDAKSIFEVPQILYDQGIMDSIFTKFGKVGMVNTSTNWDTLGIKLHLA